MLSINCNIDRHCWQYGFVGLMERNAKFLTVFTMSCSCGMLLEQKLMKLRSWSIHVLQHSHRRILDAWCNIRSRWWFLVWLFVSRSISLLHITHEFLDFLVQRLEDRIVFVLVVKGARLAAICDIGRSTPQNRRHFPSTFSNVLCKKFYKRITMINISIKSCSHRRIAFLGKNDNSCGHLLISLNPFDRKENFWKKWKPGEIFWNLFYFSKYLILFSHWIYTE